MADVGVVELDGRSRVREANAAFLTLAGRATVVGSPAGEFIARADMALHRPLWRELMAGHRVRYGLLTALRCPDGSLCRVHAVLTAVGRTGGAPSGVVAVAVAAAGGSRAEMPSPRPIEDPTPAELAVLGGLASGLTLQQLAVRLGITRRGVDYRLARLRHKLRTDDGRGPSDAIPATTAGVVARGYALGLLAPGTWPPAPSARCGSG